MSALATPDAAVGASNGARGSFARRLLRRPVAIGAIAFLALLTLACVLAPLIAPYDPKEQDLAAVLSGPTGDHLLGTDTLGRDVLSRLLHGGQRSLLSVLEGLAVVLAIGVPLGLLGGYLGGRSDRLLSRVAELLMAIPAIILVLVVLAVLPHNEDAAMVTFGVLGAPAVLRVVRGATLKLREELYVTAARVSGLSHARIVLRHILPRVTGPVIVQASIFAAYALLFETGLAYLGLTADPTTPTWGGMVAEASTVMQQQVWLLFPAGVLIAVTIMAFGLLGDAVRDAAVATEAPGRRRAVAAAPAGIGEAAAADERPDALLRVRGLSVVLERGGVDVPIVDRVSFDVMPGETLGLVGESGCGKSVSALALLRLLPSGMRVAEGEIGWEGEDVRRYSDRAFDALRGSTFAYVSQEPQASLDPTFTIGSQLVEVVRNHEHCSRAAAKERALELLRLVEIPAPERIARSHAHELSGGMAQRIAIALALAGRPRLLIADEPTTALDVTVQAEILALLRRLQEETGMAIVLITHNWGVVADICDRTVVMYAGQVVERCAVQEMFDRPLHPYTLGLLESHPSLATARGALPSMAGRVPAPGDWPAGCRFAPRCRYARAECEAAPVPVRTVEPDRVSRCVRVEQVFPVAEEVGRR
ncbi:dipeptide/oligopeptide/nickel ABC transporter permease/ATP-binding protein [Conexibacter stalactiti]|uniref:Dipeptide/oligopeptide/nickel ABC transporter permease/ATP-binding protein n=1 Tax=Conexibacter stalactiti TaxID=1940611 RepID=A0ABU4HQ48_9ACTN|nr:dipeptide/oligopeptide/nickel ABC transporter permease/ATP-binding protein [Conexibacter stalactiti]MDW5595443.1 dipeptide/oligopeptide/nickel ABC transporter permease/ATP-binding protein [Conexibacter stalactiti]MEC5036085.1 dipeptide/oligopeptide/nickel ABC transporter permease/ATP-binding protein [Conexibacter stalactiti]